MSADLRLVRLPDVSVAELASLLNDHRVTRHMPLASAMTEVDVRGWVQSKESIWAERGYGPWAILADGELAGWGGLQPFDDEPDAEVEIAIVLTPAFWGLGVALFRRFATIAFEEIGVDHVVIALPPSRTRLAGLSRLGLSRTGTTEIEGAAFDVYRLDAPAS